MSLRRYLFLSIMAAIILGLVAGSAVSCWQARRSVENEMARALGTAARIGATALPVPRGADPDAYLRRLVRGFDGDRHIQVQLSAGNAVLAVSQLAPPEPAPRWFVRLLAIPSQQQRLSVAPGLDLLVRTSPHNEISEAWGQLRDGSAVLVLSSLFILALTSLGLLRVGKPLGDLSRAFAALGTGDYATRVDPAGPSEMRYLAHAFNAMAEKLNALDQANRRLAGQLLAIQEEERAEIARDLHDEMGPLIFSARMAAERIQARHGKDLLVADQVKLLLQAIARIHEHIRETLDTLRSGEEQSGDIHAALHNLAQFWKMHHPVLTLHIVIAPDVPRTLGPAMDEALFRIAQEALTNAVRHGEGRNVWLRLSRHDGGICLVVEDDGAGFRDSGGEMRISHGLRGMRERLAAMQGEIRIGMRVPHGAVVEAIIPDRRETVRP